MKKQILNQISLIAIIAILLISSVSASVNYNGFIVNPDKAVPSNDIQSKELTGIEKILNQLSGGIQFALYPSSPNYNAGTTASLVAEVETWNVKCNSETMVAEIYQPDGSLLNGNGISNYLGSQTGSKYFVTTINTGILNQLGTHQAVAYVVCNDNQANFMINNPEYNSASYPIISSASVSKANFNVVSADSQVCLKQTMQDHTQCYNDNIYWYDNCGSLYQLKEGCSLGCKDDYSCNQPTPTQCPEPSSTCSGSTKVQTSYDSSCNQQIAQVPCSNGCANGQCNAIVTSTKPSTTTTTTGTTTTTTKPSTTTTTTGTTTTTTKPSTTTTTIGSVPQISGTCKIDNISTAYDQLTKNPNCSMELNYVMAGILIILVSIAVFVYTKKRRR